ncbi:MAG: hypothetical protein HLX50_02545 [Alteromonadaceae bacterium]|nr:hypothetical protein [Alteromonadaceae bacterium]
MLKSPKVFKVPPIKQKNIDYNQHFTIEMDASLCTPLWWAKMTIDDEECLKADKIDEE